MFLVTWHLELRTLPQNKIVTYLSGATKTAIEMIVNANSCPQVF